jgi:hypothetical protein
VKLSVAFVMCACISVAAIYRTPEGGGQCASHPCTIVVTGAGPVGARIVSPSEVQSAVDEAWLGDTVKIEAGSQSTLPPGRSIAVRKKTNGSGYFTLTTTMDSALPPSGTRITPAYEPVTAIFQKDPSAYGTADDNGPWLTIHGGAKYVAEHVRLRGLTFRIAPLSQWANPQLGQNRNMGTPFIDIGKVQAGWMEYGKLGPTSYYLIPEATVEQSGGTMVGDTSLTLSDASWVKAGMVLAITETSGNTARNEWLPIAAVSGNTVYFPDRPLTIAHPNKTPVLHWITDPAYMPNDILIEHCLFLNTDRITRVNHGIRVDGRAITIRDSMIDGVTCYAPCDSRAIFSSNGVGPLTVDNNYINSASENIMFGGGSPTGDWEMGARGPVTIRYNYMPHVLERERHGPWDLVTQQRKGQFGVDRLVMRGRHVFPSRQFAALTAGTIGAGSLQWYYAKTTGRVCTTEPLWPSTPEPGREVPDCGVTWVFAGTGSGSVPFVKNNFEIKAAQHVTLQFNALDGYPDGSKWNGNQFTAVLLKADSQGCDNASRRAYPSCYAARSAYLRVLNNTIITQAGGIQLGGGPGLYAATVTDYLVANNVVLMTEEPLVYGPYAPVRVGLPKADQVVSNFQLIHNTFYALYTPKWFGIEISNGGPSSWTGDNRVVGNIWPRGAAGFRSGYANDGGASLSIWPCGGASPANCTAQQWDKNVIVGAPSGPGNWRTGSVLSNCPTTAACKEDWKYSGSQADGQTYGALFSDSAAGQLSVRSGHAWASKALPDGSDVGADVTLVPAMNQFSVVASDRMLLFRWTVTEVIKHIPCIVEVSTVPELYGGYAGEAGDVRTYGAYLSDTAESSIREGTDRMLIVGAKRPLTASTEYFYRLQCGGAARVGTVVTTAMSGGMSLHTMKYESRDAASVNVEIGYNYSRTAGTIMTGGFVVPKCAQTVGADTSRLLSCSATIPVQKGTVLYTRWTERNSSGVVLRAKMIPVLVP